MNNQKYGFIGNLNQSFPSMVMIDLTEVCNLACIHCTHPVFKNSESYGKRMLDKELNKKMVLEVKSHGKSITKYIRYTSNGEPLVHPKSYEMINDAVANSGTKVTLTTNGTLLNEKKMNKLLDTGLHMIDISLDAFYKETYSKVRVGGDLEVTKKNVLKIIEMSKKKSKCKIIVSFVEQKENSNEINEFKKFWNQAGADDVIIRKLHTNSGSNEHNKEENKSLFNDRFPCLYPWERVILNPRGYLSFCPTDWFGKSEIEHYSKITIKELWSNAFYKNLRDQHLKCSFEGNEFCKNCPDWKNTAWPSNKNKSYGDIIERLLMND